MKEAGEDPEGEKVLAHVIEQIERPQKTALEHNEMARAQVKKLVADEALGEQFLKFVRGIKAKRNRPYKEVRDEQRKETKKKLPPWDPTPDDKAKKAKRRLEALTAKAQSPE